MGSDEREDVTGKTNEWAKRPRAIERVAALFSWLDKGVRRVEPWGILIAVIAFAVDYSDRVGERTVRAWQLVTTTAPGNSGKREALEYLNSQDGIVLFGYCIAFCKERTPLVGVYLQTTFLRAADLRGADLRKVELGGANLVDADLRNARLSDANLRAADLRGANLSGADLSGAALHSADLRKAQGLTRQQVFAACGDNDTKLPDYILATSKC